MPAVTDVSYPSMSRDSSRACWKTSRSIAAVNFPVDVFCWLG